MNDLVKNQVSEENPTDNIIDRIWTTYKCRYNASHRLLKKNSLQFLSINVIALSILALSVLNFGTSKINIELNNQIDAMLIIFSILSLALSLTVGRSDLKLESYKFHECARQLQGLYDKIKLRKEKDPNYILSGEEEEYNRILDKYDINHMKIDWEQHIFEKPDRYNKTFLQQFFFPILYFFKTRLLYWIIIIIPIIGWIFYIASVFFPFFNSAFI
ncbi:SLATT domain-containing protein [Marispirochaeta aestuarii]|uniref:SLATT domain-containing protein n=1 Tax=Marispirochaeta aestuarii TaxID=1963862 RepID=UPI002ABE01BB|nr:SLATT domain-containing protein [Marispirochaeta aestuarii]